MAQQRRNGRAAVDIAAPELERFAHPHVQGMLADDEFGAEQAGRWRPDRRWGARG
jgi:hypothetical protein